MKEERDKWRKEGRAGMGLEGTEEEGGDSTRREGREGMGLEGTEGEGRGQYEKGGERRGAKRTERRRDRKGGK